MEFVGTLCSSWKQYACARRCKIILNPPPPPPEVEADPAGKDAKKKAPAKKDAKKKGKDEAAEVVKEAAVTNIFVPDIEIAVQEFVAKWQDRDESTNFAQKYNPDLVKDELRPIVFEEIRLQVDQEMTILLENLKVRPGLLLPCQLWCVWSRVCEFVPGTVIPIASLTLHHLGMPSTTGHAVPVCRVPQCVRGTSVCMWRIHSH